MPRTSPVFVPGLEPDPRGWEGDDEAEFKGIAGKRALRNRAIRELKRPHARDDKTQSSLRQKNTVAADAARVPPPLDRSYNSGYRGTPETPDLEQRRSFPRPLGELREDPLEPTSTTPQTPRSSRRQRKRLGLPILVACPSGTFEEVMACPDSGSDENIISLKFANRLGLVTEQARPDERRQFTVANGNTVTAVGHVSTRCKFAAGTVSETTSFECVFHVFSTLAVPLIMGLDFLQQTETLSKHTDRLVEQPASAMQALRVNSVGRPKRSLVCRLDTYVGCATVDTGSDLDLVSPAFAKARAYKIEPAYEQLEFADCSVGYTSGVIKTSLAVGNVNDLGFHPRGEPIYLELFILNNLNADILVGQDTVDILDVFNLHSESLIPSMSRLGESDINIIRHIGRLEQGVANLWNKAKRNLGGNSSGSSDGVTGSPKTEVDIDQRENARRERERARIAKLTGSLKQRAEELEEIAIRDFEKKRRSRLNAYKCAFEGCLAPPFPTQDLLSSHAKIHSSPRPHCCPFRKCPRGEGGEGFEKMEEMIRHLQGHDSPGYACPFCSDRKHTYLWPDNLVRHVHIDHVDKDKYDPRLEQVLDQPFGPPGTQRPKRFLPREVLYRSL